MKKKYKTWFFYEMLFRSHYVAQWKIYSSVHAEPKFPGYGIETEILSGLRNRNLNFSGMFRNFPVSILSGIFPKEGVAVWPVHFL